ncbi:hypothetical protein GCM10027053_25320 [Intrasporangium mesophilum]
MLAPTPRTCRAKDWRVRVRWLRPGEIGSLLEIFAGPGPRSRELRFRAPRLRLTAADVHQLTDLDGRDDVALVVESADGRLVGVACFVRNEHDDSSADVVVRVVDPWPQHEVGALLTSTLVYRARRGRQRRFRLVKRPDNKATQRQLRQVSRDIERLALDRDAAECAAIATGPDLPRTGSDSLWERSGGDRPSVPGSA